MDILICASQLWKYMSDKFRQCLKCFIAFSNQTKLSKICKSSIVVDKNCKFLCRFGYNDLVIEQNMLLAHVILLYVYFPTLVAAQTNQFELLPHTRGIHCSSLHSKYIPFRRMLAQWGLDKMAATLRTTFLKTFSQKIVAFLLRFHWNLFLKIRVTIS